LDGIKGVGDVKKKALIDAFGSVEKIKNADVSDIAKVKGINEELAQRIKDKLTGGE